MTWQRILLGDGLEWHVRLAPDSVGRCSRSDSREEDLREENATCRATDTGYSHASMGEAPTALRSNFKDSTWLYNHTLVADAIEAYQPVWVMSTSWKWVCVGVRTIKCSQTTCTRAEYKRGDIGEGAHERTLVPTANLDCRRQIWGKEEVLPVPLKLCRR